MLSEFFFFFGDMNTHHYRCEESKAVAGPRAVLSHEEGPVHLWKMSTLSPSARAEVVISP